MTKIKDIIQELEQIAPSPLQESYDNAGLLVGDKNEVVTGVMYCLDSTEEVIDEAISKGCNLVVAHHPIIFAGLKRLTGSNYIQRTIIKAIQSNVAIYAIHTNLDNVLYQGVNERIAQQLEIEYYKILAPKSELLAVEITCNSAAKDLAKDLNIIFTSHELAGTETQFHCIDGENLSLVKGQFPAILKGLVQKICTTYQSNITQSPVYYKIQGSASKIGSGVIGTLQEEMPIEDFLQFLKDRMELKVIKHTDLCVDSIKKVAICGGAGGFLLKKAIAKQADIFITSDYKYHEFFDADNRIIIADIGHFESEQFTIKLLCSIISEKFSNFANYCTSVQTNPVNYF